MLGRRRKRDAGGASIVEASLFKKSEKTCIGRFKAL